MVKLMTSAKKKIARVSREYWDTDNLRFIVNTSPAHPYFYGDSSNRTIMRRFKKKDGNKENNTSFEKMIRFVSLLAFAKSRLSIGQTLPLSKKPEIIWSIILEILLKKTFLAIICRVSCLEYMTSSV